MPFERVAKLDLRAFPAGKGDIDFISMSFKARARSIALDAAVDVLAAVCGRGTKAASPVKMTRLNIAGIYRIGIGQLDGANGGIDAVGANQQIAGSAAAVGKYGSHAVGPFVFDCHQSCIQVVCRIGDLFTHGAVQHWPRSERLAHGNAMNDVAGPIQEHPLVRHR